MKWFIIKVWGIIYIIVAWEPTDHWSRSKRTRPKKDKWKECLLIHSHRGRKGLYSTTPSIMYSFEGKLGTFLREWEYRRWDFLTIFSWNCATGNKDGKGQGKVCHSVDNCLLLLSKNKKARRGQGNAWFNDRTLLNFLIMCTTETAHTSHPHTALRYGTLWLWWLCKMWSMREHSELTNLWPQNALSISEDQK